MTILKKALAATVIACTPFATSHAAEVSGNVTMATDYVFRGVSQTDEKPAIQGGFDVDFGNGFYVGTWASNVDFGPSGGDGGAQAEMDFYGGYAFAINDTVSLDLGAVYFHYPGDSSALDYEEYVATLGVSDFSFGLVYSPEYFGDGGPDAFVLNADYSLGLTDKASMDFHIGYSEADEDDFFEPGEDSYIDYKVGVNYDVAGVTLGLAWYGTDLDSELADDRAVFSISKSL